MKRFFNKQKGSTLIVLFPIMLAAVILTSGYQYALNSNYINNNETVKSFVEGFELVYGEPEATAIELARRGDSYRNKTEHVTYNNSHRGAYRVVNYAKKFFSKPTRTVRSSFFNYINRHKTSSPKVTFTASESTISLGEKVTLKWNSQNADQVNINPGIGEVENNGSVEVSPTSSTTYTITATGPGGTVSSTQTIVVSETPVEQPKPAPTIDFSANPGSIVESGSADLVWNSDNATKVTIDQGIGEVSLDGAVTVWPQVTTTYAIVATGDGGTALGQVTVTVTEVAAKPAPTVTLSTNRTTIGYGTSYTSAVLTWSTTDATQIAFNPSIGNVNLNGSATVQPASTTTYTLTATGPGGTASKKVTINVQTPPPAPSATFSASPTSIGYGTNQTSSTLNWATANATSVSFSPSIGSTALSGSKSVSPTTTTTYTMTATGNGTITKTVTITVVPTPPVPVANFIASPTTIGYGTSASSSTLTWTTANATSVSFSPSIGSTALSGSKSVSPTSTTTYTMTATGNGTVTKIVTINVVQTPPTQTAPTVTFSANPISIGYGTSASSSTLTWTSTNATSVSFSPSIGSTALSGSKSVSPTATTTYTVTATGSGGNTTKAVTITYTPTPSTPPSGSISVKTYGAKGDGSTDDTTACQNAINSLGTSGGTIVFPSGTYVISSPLKLPSGNNALMTLDGSASPTIKLTASMPKFLVWNKTAANQTFRKFKVIGFQLNGMNKTGDYYNSAVIGDTKDGWATDINVEDVTVQNNRLYGALEMKGINIYSGQGDSTSNHITNINIIGNRLEGVNHGVTVWATKESNGASQVWLDNIIIRDNWTDTTRNIAGPISNYHVGQYGIVGRTEITGNYGANTGDNCVEINNSTYALVENNTFVSPLWWATYYANYSAPPATQTFITRNNKTIVNRVTPKGGNYGYGIGNSGYQMPNATFTYENNSYEITSAVTGGDHRAFATHSVTAKSLLINGLTVTHKTNLSSSFFVDVSGLSATKTIGNVTVNGVKLTVSGANSLFAPSVNERKGIWFYLERLRLNFYSYFERFVERIFLPL